MRASSSHFCAIQSRLIRASTDTNLSSRTRSIDQSIDFLSSLSSVLVHELMQLLKKSSLDKYRPIDEWSIPYIPQSLFLYILVQHFKKRFFLLYTFQLYVPLKLLLTCLIFKHKLSRTIIFVNNYYTKITYYLLFIITVFLITIFFLFAFLKTSSITIRRTANHNGLVHRLTDCVKLNSRAYYSCSISRVNCVPCGSISVIWKIDRPSDKLPRSRISRNNIQHYEEILSPIVTLRDM